MYEEGVRADGQRDSVYNQRIMRRRIVWGGHIGIMMKTQDIIDKMKEFRGK
jgi:hypothetical protein